MNSSAMPIRNTACATRDNVLFMVSLHGVIVTEDHYLVHTDSPADPMKRLAKIVGGFTLLTAGLLMLALPGPGWLTIALGLAMLATEYEWARNLLDRLKHLGTKLRRSRPGHRDTQRS
jgi:uncharacterized protein (TIGR02611 family)